MHEYAVFVRKSEDTVLGQHFETSSIEVQSR